MNDNDDEKTSKCNDSTLFEFFSNKNFAHFEFFFSVTKRIRNFISCDDEKNDDEKTKELNSFDENKTNVKDFSNRSFSRDTQKRNLKISNNCEKKDEKKRL